MIIYQESWQIKAEIDAASIVKEFRLINLEVLDDSSE